MGNCAIPGYMEAIASERRDRAAAFLGIPELIAGREVSALTPQILEWLRLAENPFAVGGESVSREHVLQFIWAVSREFADGNEAFGLFISTIPEDFDEAKAADDICAYMDRAFLDAPHGKVTTPHFSFAAGLAHQMACGPYRLPWQETMRIPVAIIFQLIKARDKFAGATVINTRSDKAAGDWLAELNKQNAADQKEREATNG